MATSRKTDMLCPECGSEDTGNTLHKNTYQFECGTHWIPAEFHAGPYEYRSVSVACRTIKAMRAVVDAALVIHERFPTDATKADRDFHKAVETYLVDIEKVHDDV